ncbi:helix-turn-helix domain-containing protein [Pedobacter sp. HMF7647]|uniref:Helix-turn-helix domain-containing protein n=1 Tax=Hufsiella arboris TaxID=2695275 RepID=A0A7K1Y8W0_9SPHI|nr:AraC family transcriptional regulator [Hufsiella arboris]MXV50860.1 helix-turn-helix domain-containing protein [Hufsiella arboris]
MKPVLEYLPRSSDESFVTRFFDYHYYPTPWHFHPEYELVLVTESSGKRFIGDQISDFREGDLALIGPFLPHLYRNDPEYYEPGSKLRAKSIVVHFKESSFGNDFINLPEAKKINQLLLSSGQGFDIYGETNRIISEKMFELTSIAGFSRWLKLLEILNILADSKELRSVSNNPVVGKNQLESVRMNKVIDHVINNFHKEITISEVADIASMADNSFSRYFSQRTRKTFTSFVNEVRLNHASKLLIETQKSIIDISLECGFTNLSNFNRQFKAHYHSSPLNFRKHYHG